MRKIWRPYTQEFLDEAPVEIAQARGAHLIAKNGARYFDGISSWWLTTHGHCHPVIMEAIRRQTEKLDQVVFANFTHEPAEQLVENLSALLPPALNKFFFSDNGSTAVEVALKMTLQACAQTGRSRRTKFLAFEGSYHGDTVGAMSVSGDTFASPYSKLLFDVLRHKRPQTELDFTSFEEILQRGDVAAVIVEPLIQAAGGMIVWSEESLRRIAKICRETGTYLIFDEVMTGFGRTGSLFAMIRADVVPDLVCLSKGLTGGSLPLSLTVATTSLYDCFLGEERHRLFFHGHSFTGNPISCAAAVASLSLFTEATFARLAQIEALHERRLANFHTPIRNARVCGTLAAFDLELSEYGGKGSREFMRRALSRGLFIRPLGNVVYLLPPYCATDQELNEAWDILGEIATPERSGPITDIRRGAG